MVNDRGQAVILSAKQRNCCGFFNKSLGKANPYSFFQHVYHRSCSFYYNFSNFFYIFENVIDISLYILYEHYLTVHDNDYYLQYFYNNFNSSFTLTNCCLENINININKSHTSLCLTNNVFLFGQNVICCFFYPQLVTIPLSFVSKDSFFQAFFTK